VKLKLHHDELLYFGSRPIHQKVVCGTVRRRVKFIDSPEVSLEVTRISLESDQEMAFRIQELEGDRQHNYAHVMQLPVPSDVSGGEASRVSFVNDPHRSSNLTDIGFTPCISLH
jgi:hypothetical protein